jgi:hypothetical protein
MTSPWLWIIRSGAFLFVYSEETPSLRVTCSCCVLGIDDLLGLSVCVLGRDPVSSSLLKKTAVYANLLALGVMNLAPTNMGGHGDPPLLLPMELLMYFP